MTLGVLPTADDVILPNVDVLERTTPGSPRRSVLVTLNASARNSMCWDSVTLNWRTIVWSHSQNPGATITPTPVVPKVPVAGRAKAAGFSQETQGPGEQLIPWFVAEVSPSTTLGRCGTGKVPDARKMPFRATSEPVFGVR